MTRPTPRRRPLRPTALPLAALLAAAASTARAQDVGSTPAESPFRDIVYRQEMTAFGGYYAASEDPVGVAPQSGPMFGLRYEIRLGGPAQFYARAAVARSERTVIDPTKAPDERTVGTDRLALGLLDVGISMNLTGQKSWHHLVPVVAGGLGVATSFEGEDAGGYRFGTPFALTFGGGVRWVPGGRFQLRADITDHLYQIRYPGTYYTPPATGVPAVLTPSQKQNVWKHNAALTVGFSYLFWR
ncbi:MAG TPA: hypothetical protein VFS08_17510 [Gemmatimonadaceae bacterium]|nr:hypothetical protein [Gemmatimonadaceae bacterium]